MLILHGSSDILMPHVLSTAARLPVLLRTLEPRHHFSHRSDLAGHVHSGPLFFIRQSSGLTEAARTPNANSLSFGTGCSSSLMLALAVDCGSHVHCDPSFDPPNSM
jgi:hypothetical protein